MSDANQQRKSVKVAVCICQLPINKEKVLKLRYVYVTCQSTTKSVKVAVCICQMSINKERVEVAVRICHMSINKEKC